MSAPRLLDHWVPPTGLVLASAIATTYECQADFLEEDLLTVALQLQNVPAAGRAYRLELERALQDVEFTVFLHPQRYQRGQRRSPRIDLVPVHETRVPKLHAKIALLRFVDPLCPETETQVVRLIVTSANLTAAGYRNNLEIAVALDDAPGADPRVATAVRDATKWLERLLGKATAQTTRQLRDLNAIFRARSISPQRDGIRFLGLPFVGGLPKLLPRSNDVTVRLTIVSPFWPAGTKPADVVTALTACCGGLPTTVRLLGPAHVDDDGVIHPMLPAAFVAAWLRAGVRVEVAAAQPDYGCGESSDRPAGEFDALEGRAPPIAAHRPLHAKMLLFEGKRTTRLAAGSFNLTRRGLGIGRNTNVEAGLLWTLPKKKASKLHSLTEFAHRWVPVEGSLSDIVVEPTPYTGTGEVTWPAWLHSIRARGANLEIEFASDGTPDQIRVRMRDIRGRLVAAEHWFDTWLVTAPSETTGPTFTVSSTLTASWLAEGEPVSARWKPLPDLEAELSWDGHITVVPVLFCDKDQMLLVEGKRRLGERALIDWFLGLRPKGEGDGEGFAHSLDPSDDTPVLADLRAQLLSYLVRDFVHALPGIHTRLQEAGLTETGLRTSLLGPRSPVALAHEAVAAWRERTVPRKSAIATAFQLVELLEVLHVSPLRSLPDNQHEVLRAEAIQQVTALLEQVTPTLATSASTTLAAYLDGRTGGPNASA